jgi:outer membrane protein OmpA-like peptidoglycan-associated protein
MPRLAIVFVCAATTAAAAQSAGNLNLDEFRPAIDANGYLTVNGSTTLGDKEVSFGLGSLDWGRHLLSFQSGPQTYSVNNMVSATLVGAFGLELGRVPLELATSLPLSIMNGANNLSGQGVGDLGFHLKTRFARVGGVGFGAIASVYLPTATKNSFFGESGVTPQFVGVIDRSFGAEQRLRISANGGIRLRPTATFTDSMMTMGTITTSTEVPFGLAAAYAVVPRKFELVAEMYGAIPIGPHQNYQSLEALGGVKLYLAKNSYLSIGAGRGLATSMAGSPDFRGVIGIVFEPSRGDRGRAHVVDDNTIVTAEPPPPPRDSDNDKIDDPNKLCNVQVQIDCPDRQLAVETEGEIVTLKTIEFEYDSAVIKPVSYPIVDAVAATILRNSDITLIEVGGHTDERGSAAYNLDLSKRRAAAVKKYLVGKGVAPERLDSHGYGLTVPLDPRHVEEAWQKNRRVEFVIKKRG